jgi:hypothetical protein
VHLTRTSARQVQLTRYTAGGTPPARSAPLQFRQKTPNSRERSLLRSKSDLTRASEASESELQQHKLKRANHEHCVGTAWPNHKRTQAWPNQASDLPTLNRANTSLHELKRVNTSLPELKRVRQKETTRRLR